MGRARATTAVALTRGFNLQLARRGVISASGIRGMTIGACLALLLATSSSVAQSLSEDGSTEQEAGSEQEAEHEPSALEQCAERLATALKPNYNAHRSEPWTAGVMVGLGAGVGGVGAVLLAEGSVSPEFAGLMLAAGGTALVGGLSTYAVPDPFRSYLFDATLAGAEALLLLGLDTDVTGMGGRDEIHTWPGGAGALTTAALMLVNGALANTPGNAALSRDYERLSDPKARDTLTEEELDAIRRRYVASRPVLSRWIVMAPAAVGIFASGIWTMADHGSDGTIAFAVAPFMTTFAGMALGQAIRSDLDDADMIAAGFDVSFIPTVTGGVLLGRF